MVKRRIALVLLLVLSACTSPPDSDSAAAYVRVDQVGYGTDGSKRAYLMSESAPGSDVRFRVLDEAGTQVLEGSPAAAGSGWNDRYRDVRVLDLTALTKPGSYRVEVAGAVSPTLRVDTAPFGGLVGDNIAFFGTQRDSAHVSDRTADVYATPHYDEDGKKLLDERLTKVGGPVDVSGGWFDAGDFLKFTHTTSYATAQLLLAQRDSALRSDALAAEARYGVEWLDRMWDADSGTLYAQVGIGAGNDAVLTDHDVWRQPQDDEALQVAPGDPKFHIKHRPVFRANEPGQPISPNLAGRVAAAFALSAQVDVDRVRARQSLEQAAALFAKADTSGGPLVTAFPKNFYPESAWQDDLEFAAVELALAGRALGDARAAQWQAAAGQWATTYLDSDTRGTLGLADVSAMAHADLARIVDGPLRERLVEDLSRQLDEGVARAAKDPFGAGAVYTEFDSVPHALGLAITAALHRSVTGDGRYDAFAAAQRDWVLGANAWGSTFVIGAGTTSPRCPEHQGGNLTGTAPRGAVVNGPNAAGQFAELNAFEGMKACVVEGFDQFDGNGARYVDHVGAWQSVEAAIDFTSTGLLAFAG